MVFFLASRPVFAAGWLGKVVVYFGLVFGVGHLGHKVDVRKVLLYCDDVWDVREIREVMEGTLVSAPSWQRHAS